MGDITEKETIGILLLNLGGPDSLRAVRPFLYNLFSDRQIIKLGPSFLQKPIAWLISSTRHKKTEGFYSLIGGKSPILDITNAQARALEEALNQSAEEHKGKGAEVSDYGTMALLNYGAVFKVYVGMRYWYPLIGETLECINNDGIRKLIVLSLYPQYSLATTGSSISKFKEVVSKYKIDYFCSSSWFNNPFYIEALVDVIKKGIKSFNTDSPDFADSRRPEPMASDEAAAGRPIHILFSAHSLPQKFIDEGDPYVSHIMGTITEVTKKMDIEWHLSYQSKSGPVKWLAPSTDEKLRELAGGGIKNILVVPISFVSDHIETLYEIDILYRQMAEKLGINLKRTESLNTHPLFINAMKDIVMTNIKEAGWLK